MLLDNIFDTITRTDKIINELKVFLSQEGKNFFTNVILFMVNLNFLDKNHNKRAKTKGISRLLP